MLLNKRFLFGLLVSIYPGVALGADLLVAGSNFKTVAEYVLNVIQLLVPILSAIAFFVFFWGLSIFILRDSGSEKTRGDGKKKMFWGILALFVLLTFMTIIGLISNELEIGPKDANVWNILLNTN